MANNTWLQIYVFNVCEQLRFQQDLSPEAASFDARQRVAGWAANTLVENA